MPEVEEVEHIILMLEERVDLGVEDMVEMQQELGEVKSQLNLEQMD
jgi:hypothetical protein